MQLYANSGAHLQVLPVGEAANVPFAMVTLTEDLPATDSPAGVGDRLEQFLLHRHGSCDPRQRRALKVVPGTLPNRLAFHLAVAGTVALVRVCMLNGCAARAGNTGEHVPQIVTKVYAETPGDPCPANVIVGSVVYIYYT